jgi:hypothetical protein
VNQRNQRVKHDAALMGGHHCVEFVSNVLDPEQQQQALQGFYEIILATLEAYDLQSDRMRQRLKPLQN